jgi:hypothetical protein
MTYVVSVPIAGHQAVRVVVPNETMEREALLARALRQLEQELTNGTPPFELQWDAVDTIHGVAVLRDGATEAESKFMVVEWPDP